MIELVSGANPRAWAARHGIEPFTAPCSDCGVECTTTVPIVRFGRPGLRAADCSCGNKSTPYCLILEELS